MGKNYMKPSLRNARRSKRLGLRLVMEYELEVRDADGKLVKRVKGISDSFVRNWIRMLRTMHLCTTSLETLNVSLLQTNGVSGTFVVNTVAGSSLIQMGAKCPADTNAYGIRVGTNPAPFDRTHYELQTIIAHGSGAGQMLYGATTIEDYSETDGEVQFRHIRAIVNNSGASITVYEIGIAIANMSAGTVRYFLIARDVIAGGVVVPAGNTLTIRYRMFVSY